MKRIARVSMAALLAAAFSFLAVRQHGSLVAANLRDFNVKYFEFENKVDQRIEPVFRLGLITNAWTTLDERDRKTIRESVRNRKAFQELQQAYQALDGLGFDDRQIGTMISAMSVPDFARDSAGLATEPARLPAGLQRVSAGAVRMVNFVEYPARNGPVPEPPEEVRVMDSAVSASLLDIVGGNANHQRLFQWLNIHFPGLDDILQSIQDAGRESLMEWKQARDRVIQRNLASHRSSLDDLVANEAPAAAARVLLHPPHLSDRSRSIAAERDAIHRAEASLHRQAPKVIQGALQGSKTRTHHMALQMQKLDERYPFLHLSTFGFNNPVAGYTTTSGSWAMSALNSTSAQEALLRSLEKIKAYAGADLIDQLRRQIETEQHHENLLAELVGRGESEAPEMRAILGPEFDRYNKIYEARQR